MAWRVHEETRNQFTNPDFDAEIKSLMVCTQVRPGFVLQQVANAVSGAQRLRIGR